MCKYYITVTFISSRSHEKYNAEQTIMIFLSTHQATNLCFRGVKKKKTEGVCRAEYNPDVASFSQLVPPACWGPFVNTHLMAQSLLHQIQLWSSFSLSRRGIIKLV